MRPHIICHMLGSVDGKIRQNIWGFKDHHTYFEEPASKIKADAWLVGRVTMQEFSSKKAVPASKKSVRIPKEDFVAGQPAKQFAVVIDPSGKCTWDSNMVSTEHVIEVLTEKVSSRYLAHLREKTCRTFSAAKQSSTSTLLSKSCTGFLPSNGCALMAADM